MRHASTEAPADTSTANNTSGDLAGGAETRTPAEVKSDGMVLWKRLVEYQDKECAPLFPSRACQPQQLMPQAV